MLGVISAHSPPDGQPVAENAWCDLCSLPTRQSASGWQCLVWSVLTPHQTVSQWLRMLGVISAHSPPDSQPMAENAWCDQCSLPTNQTVADNAWCDQCSLPTRQSANGWECLVWSVLTPHQTVSQWLRMLGVISAHSPPDSQPMAENAWCDQCSLPTRQSANGWECLVWSVLTPHQTVSQWLRMLGVISAHSPPDSQPMAENAWCDQCSLPTFPAPSPASLVPYRYIAQYLAVLPAPHPPPPPPSTHPSTCKGDRSCDCACFSFCPTRSTLSLFMLLPPPPPHQNYSARCAPTDQDPSFLCV